MRTPSLRSSPGRTAARSLILCGLFSGLVELAGPAAAAGPATPPLQAAPATVIDCPLRDAGYDVDSPLIDILLNPAAVAAVEGVSPGLLSRLPAKVVRTEPPSTAAILSLRALVGFMGVDPALNGRLDAALSTVAASQDDKVARCARYDVTPLDVPPSNAPVRLLVFEKIVGFRDGPSVEAARKAIAGIAARHGWDVVVTDRGGAFTPDVLAQFDAVVWNNVSGDVLTSRQRDAFRAWLEKGGGFVGVHGSGGDAAYAWRWYADSVLGAQFSGHPDAPQFQAARIVVDPTHPLAAGLGAEWTMTDEWYSFVSSPRASGAHVIAALDEATYNPVDRGQSLAMGSDHPIAWTRCVGDGRAFYSAIGHRPDAYDEPHHLRLLDQAIGWAVGQGPTLCRAGQEVAAATERP